MRRCGPVLCLALFFGLMLLDTSVAAADPTIGVGATRRDANGVVVGALPVTDKQGNVLPPLLLLGEYVVTSGQGFAPNQPVMAYLVVQNQALPLSFQDLTTSVTATQRTPMTDAAGGFQNLAFALPVTGQVTGGTGELLVSVGAATARAPVGIASGVATVAGRGDKIAVGIGAGFAAVAILLILLLLRGLPIYPVGTPAARRVKEPETT